MFEQISQFFSKIGPGLKSEDPLLTSIVQWVARLQLHAFGRWSAVVKSGVKCDIREQRGAVVMACDQPAIASCQLCRQPVCLHHAAVASNGNVACARCLMVYAEVVRAHVRQHAAPPPEPQVDPKVERKRCLRVLGLRDPASADEIKQAYRTLAAKHHPDKVTDEKKKTAATAKLRDINAAYAWLQANAAQKAA